MGHNIHYDTCEDTEKAKKGCEAYWNEYAAREDWQEGCSGLSQPIRWCNHICEDYDEAQEYIESHDKGWYDQLAVKFYEYPEIKESKTYEVLKERLQKAQEKYNEASRKIHYKGVKSKFITCRSCESKLCSEYFGKTLNNMCPVCHNDLRPISTLETIEGYKNNVEKLRKEVKAEEKKLNAKQKKQAKIKWLVKIEYHT